MLGYSIIKTRGEFGKRLIRSNYKEIHKISMEFNQFYKSQKKYHKVVNVHLDCLFPGVLTLWMSLVINLRMRLQGIHQWM